jgi:hypothetical protein
MDVKDLSHKVAAWTVLFSVTMTSTVSRQYIRRPRAALTKLYAIQTVDGHRGLFCHASNLHGSTVMALNKTYDPFVPAEEIFAMHDLCTTISKSLS